MTQVTFTRAEWATIAEMVADSDPAEVPSGLAQRIDALLRSTPASWPNEPCVLELEEDSAAVVEGLAATHRGLADAERIIRDHQEGNATASHRIELHSNGVSSVVAYLTDSTNLHRELERHARRLRTTGATGHLALVDQASLEVLATAALPPDDSGD